MINYRKLGSAGIVSFGIILLPLLVLPQYNLISETRKTIESRKADFEKKQAMIGKIEDLKKQVKEKQSDMSKLASILPETKKTQDVLVNLEEIAKESGIELKTVKLASLAGTGGQGQREVKTLQIEISSGGQYQSLVNFIKLIEKNLRVFDLQEFNLSLNASATVAGELNFAAKINSYYIE